MVTISNRLYSRTSFDKPKLDLCGFTQFKFDGVLAVPPAFPLENDYVPGLLKNSARSLNVHCSSTPFWEGHTEASLPLAVVSL